jgi:hypothetical protein
MLMMFNHFLQSEWSEKLTVKEWNVYVRLLMHIHDWPDHARIRNSWNFLTAILGMRNKNITVFRILKKFHEAQKVIWENYEEFTSRVPLELRDRLGIDPDIGVSEQGTIPKWKVCKGGVIRDRVVLFAPQVIEIHEALMREFRRKRKAFQRGSQPCPYHDECQFLRTVGEKDYCSDGSVARWRLEKTLRGHDKGG